MYGNSNVFEELKVRRMVRSMEKSSNAFFVFTMTLTAAVALFNVIRFILA